MCRTRATCNTSSGLEKLPSKSSSHLETCKCWLRTSWGTILRYKSHKAVAHVRHSWALSNGQAPAPQACTDTTVASNMLFLDVNGSRRFRSTLCPTLQKADLLLAHRARISSCKLAAADTNPPRCLYRSTKGSFTVSSSRTTRHPASLSLKRFSSNLNSILPPRQHNGCRLRRSNGCFHAIFSKRAEEGGSCKRQLSKNFLRCIEAQKDC